MRPYLPAELPRLAPARDDAAWWEALRRHELVVQRCSACGTWRHPPSPICPACRASTARFDRVSGRGRVFSYTVVHHAVHPALADHLPYNVVLVELPDAGGVRLISNVVDVAPMDLRIGLEVEVVFEDLDDATTLPRFRRCGTSHQRPEPGVGGGSTR